MSEHTLRNALFKIPSTHRGLCWLFLCIELTSKSSGSLQRFSPKTHPGECSGWPERRPYGRIRRKLAIGSIVYFHSVRSLATRLVPAAFHALTHLTRRIVDGIPILTGVDASTTRNFVLLTRQVLTRVTARDPPSVDYGNGTTSSDLDFVSDDHQFRLVQRPAYEVVKAQWPATLDRTAVRQRCDTGVQLFRGL